MLVQVLREFAVGRFFFLQVKKAKDFFYRRATYKGTYLEAVESAKEGGSREGKVPCAPDRKILFFGSRVLGF